MESSLSVLELKFNDESIRVKKILGNGMKIFFGVEPEKFGTIFTGK